MADKTKRILTIDIGGDTLKMAEFSYTQGVSGLTLEVFGFKQMTGQDDDPVGAFEKAYRDLLREKPFTAKEVRMTISGQVTFVRLAKIPPLVGDQKAIAKIVEFEAKQTVPYAMDEIVWDYQLIRHTADSAPHPEEEEKESPEENFEALFVAVKKDLAIAYTDAVARSKKSVLSLGISPIASFNAGIASYHDENPSCHILLNIGARCTCMVIAENERLFVRSIPIGGDSITQQISKEFGIPPTEAEEMKCRHGFVALGGAYEEPDSEVAATISKIARNVMTRLHGEVSRSINVWRSQHHGGKPGHLWLAGGASQMPYLSDFFKEKLQVPLDYLNCFTVVALNPSINKDELSGVAPMFSELIGMALRSIIHCPVEINLIPDTVKMQRDICAKRPYFYACNVVLIVCLLIFYIGLTRRMLYDQDRSESTRHRVEETDRMKQDVGNAYAKMEEMRNTYQRTVDIAKQRTLMIEIYEGLANALPDTVYLKSVEFIGEQKTSERAAPRKQSGKKGGLFGRRTQPEAETVTESSAGSSSRRFSQITEIRISGYQLVLSSGGKSLDEILNTELRKIPLISTDADAVKFEDYQLPRDSNIRSFTLKLKLKQPIRML